MTHTYKTEAIIVKRINLGEADRIVTALTKDYGKIRFVAKGVRRTKSKLSGSTEPFYKSILVISKGKNLDILSSAEVIKTFLSPKPSLTEIKTVNYMAEIIDKIVPDYVEEPDLFNILEGSLLLLPNSSLAKLAFESRFYQHSGVFPLIDKCVKCGDIPEKPYFSYSANGVLCESCKRDFYDAVPIKKKTLEYWTKVSETPDTKGIEQPSSKVFNECIEISGNYLKTLTNYKFKSILI